jgi:glucose-1-phosphate adenylyltransferase
MSAAHSLQALKKGMVIMQKECIAMLLAGGVGSRLEALTLKRAKPAVCFGGKYRIIDFTLSNCVNSGIETIGVLTQYQPLDLNDYIGSGQPWDLDRTDGGVHILPPYQRRESADWYKGTANAITQNIPFIERYQPIYVLILSGDHIYKMDYSKMLQYHKEKGADCTIAVIEVGLKDASRFGIMNTKDDGSIYEFEEKPKEPKSKKASMGVYIFTWDKLLSYLRTDENTENSSHDFGKDIIPTMLKSGEKMYAYPFSGYWRDVGTIESLWEANMDLIHSKENIISSNTDWKIYARSPVEPPQYVSSTSKVTSSILSEGCIIQGEVDTSILHYGVEVEPDAVILNSIIMPGAKIKKGSKINYAIIDEEAIIGENAIIEGNNKNNKPSIIVIGSKEIIENGAIVEEGTLTDK